MNYEKMWNELVSFVNDRVSFEKNVEEQGFIEDAKYSMGANSPYKRILHQIKEIEENKFS